MSTRTAPLVALLVLGCQAEPADQLLVEIVDGSDGALRIPEDLDAFELRVATQFGTLDEGRQVTRYRRTFRLGVARGGLDLPQSLAIVPADEDSSGTVTVEVRGLRDGRERQLIRRTTAFGRGLVRFPPFELTPACFAVVCPAGQTCEGDGVCRDAEVECPGPGCPIGGDAGNDAGTDAGGCAGGELRCGTSCVPQDEANCGACGVSCTATERCVAGACLCAAGLERCGTGCVDTRSDRNNCGACGLVCNAPRATTGCSASSCVLAACTAPYQNCNGLYADGCENDLRTDRDNCGACGRTCAYPNASSVCVSGTCQLFDCNAGYADCDGATANGCETATTCVAGAPCTTTCGSTGTTSCGAAGCTETCLLPTESCNGEDDDCDAACDEDASCRAPVHRGFDPAGGYMGMGGAHLYSRDPANATPLEFMDYFYVYESRPAMGYQRLYRCTSPGPDFLTRSSLCEGAGTVVETLGWVAIDERCGSVPLYRLYHNPSRDHLYTISDSERMNAIDVLGLNDEGIVGYVWLSP